MAAGQACPQQPQQAAKQVGVVGQVVSSVHSVVLSCRYSYNVHNEMRMMMDVSAVLYQNCLYKTDYEGFVQFATLHCTWPQGC